MDIRAHSCVFFLIPLTCSILTGCNGQGSSPVHSEPAVSYTVGGSVSGLSGGQLVLEDNGGDNLAVSANGSFTFSKPIKAGNPYVVTILTEPSSPAQTCSVNNANGVVEADVTSLQITCFMLPTGPIAMVPGEWTWSGGSSTLDSTDGQRGIYGTSGVAAAGNIPGGRYGANSWTDQAGHFWLFGGAGSDSNDSYGRLNDLWEFDPSTSEWAWMTGGNTVYQPGVYGTLGVAASGNTPGSRQQAASWTDLNGRLWLFGGIDVNDGASQKAYNDLWEFNPSTKLWGWMGGSGTPSCSVFCGEAGVYGTLGTPSAGNIPGGRASVVTWIDKNGNFWLFGGVGYDSNDVEGMLNDLWKFDPSTNQWAWMGGASTLPLVNGSYSAPPGVYGTLGVPAQGNYPGARWSGSGWTDNSGNLWLFGGFGKDANGNLGDLNDLWEFNPSTNQWAWMGGSSTMIYENGAGEYSQPGVYGTLGTAAPANIPGGRDSALTWTDRSGNFWLAGGTGADASGNGGPRNDLWRFDSSKNEWTWVGGSSEIPCVVLYQGINDPLMAVKCGINGVYGTLGTPAAGDLPGSRFSSASWTDSSGNLWLFGGAGLGSSGGGGDLNDLWVYQP